MAWDNFPIPEGQDIQGWDWLSQFYRALRERAWVLRNEFWPRTSLAYATEARPTSYSTGAGYSGILSSAPSASGDNYILTDAGRSWIVGFSADALAPSLWDVVIEHDELNPWGVVRAEVVGNTADTITVRRGAIDDAVVAKQIPSAASLGGKRFLIVRRHTSTHPSLHWNDRWLPWPNAEELAAGTVTSLTASSLTDIDKAWQADEWVGKEVMTLDGNGRLKRLAVTASGRDTLFFSDPPLTFDDLYTSGAGNIDVNTFAGNFTPDMVGRHMVIDGGTGFTPGTYTITNYVSSTSVYLDVSPTPAGAGSNGTGHVLAAPVASGADYAVIAPGGRWRYGATRPAPWRWYGGFDSPTSQALIDPRYYSHHPDGTI